MNHRRLGSVGRVGREVAPHEFAELFTERASGLRRTAYLLCGDWQRAEDLVQTAFAKVLAARRGVRERAALPAYLRRTLTRTYIDESRRRWRREEPSSELLDSADPAGSSTEDRLVLLAVLDQLPTRQRACLVLRFYDDCGVDETAAALGCSTGTVKSNTARGLDRLRRLLVDLDLELTTASRKET